MTNAFLNVLGAAAVLIALPLFFTGFVLAPLVVLAVGYAAFHYLAPDE